MTEHHLHEAGGDAPNPWALRRVSTGSIPLDGVLGGGFPANSINVIMGEPGSGKTILAEHLMFANAHEGDRPILYFSTLSEPIDKVVRYLQQFRFYDHAKIGRTIHYDSLGDDLAAHGINSLVPRLKEAIKKWRPKIIVIDSFKAVHDLTSSLPESRRMLYEMSGLLTAYETTTFLVGEYTDAHVATCPEFAVADGMIMLARHRLGTRDERFLRVLKLRGSAYLEGLHGFRITDDGLQVYPRLVSPDVPPYYDLRRERVGMGVEGLTKILGGGPYRGTTTLLMGQTGTGKTTLALQFVLEGIQRGEPAVYVNFEENPTQLTGQIAGLGHDPAVVQTRGLHLLYRSPVELQIDSIVSEIMEMTTALGARRIVIDAVGDLLLAASDPLRVHCFLYALTQQLAVNGVATLLTVEGTLEPGQGGLSALADSVIVLGLQSNGKARRTLQVVKARGIEHDLDVHELKISSRGVAVD